MAGADPRDAETPPDEVETEVLLAQGDELLRSSRDLLEELDDVLPVDPLRDDDAAR